ncbi:MAG: DNA mismatch repair protein MutS [Spirochaetes bacterium ADurb.BinA120]|nr:MAG: DNA mismatch repair protein MutS [Spirochaetes bacterium ADurb.BinA120]
MDAKLTPMLKQYLEIKKKHPGEILFFRMGDFYEMFFDDAHTASKALSIALTSRQNDVPMCGVPHHAAESYIARLIKAGHRVAICEQMEAVPSSGTVVRREVTRVITPGTLVEQNLLQSDHNNYLASVVEGPDRIAFAFVDVSTGDFHLSSMAHSADKYRGELARFSPREAIHHSMNGADDTVLGYLKSRGIPVNRINEWLYDVEYLTSAIAEAFRLAGIKGLGMEDPLEILAAGSILEYLKDTHKKAFGHLKPPRRIVASDYMALDEATIANLELVHNSNDGGRERTLYSVLNRTKTAMGRRLLERNLLQPLIRADEIEKRLDTVRLFHESASLTADLQDRLDGVYDIERLIARFVIGRCTPRDYLALAASIEAALETARLLEGIPHELGARIIAAANECKPLAKLIGEVIDDDPALSPEQGRVVRPGRSAELDRLYDLKKDSKNWMVEYQEEEKRRLEIPTLKVKYNRVLGYYIEVSKGQSSKVPADYFRKQTLVGAERYTTGRLQSFESDILGASQKIAAMETAELESLHGEVLAQRPGIQELAEALGEIDFHCSLAVAALENRFVRPSFNDRGVMNVSGGRHPIVEKYYTREVFIPNDVRMDDSGDFIKIITGPNMSGKSTYIRMAAIIQLMAQAGSYVPAASAELPIADRIFTRIGASDNISRGESTFLVEMNETALILNNATHKSLIVMDEVGRGTSTFDGLSIAWAVVEYILRYIRAKTLFATHYHELTRLGGRRGIVNYTVLVKEHMGGVDFLHRVVPGAADRSYGIHVARLAGIPREITARAQKILERMEKTNRAGNAPESAGEDDAGEQLEIFNAANHRLVQAIRALDIDTLTPLDAMNELNRLKKLVE